MPARAGCWESGCLLAHSAACQRLPGSGWGTEQPARLLAPVCSWANEFSAPRYGQGAFFACLDTLHMKVRAARGGR